MSVASANDYIAVMAAVDATDLPAEAWETSGSLLVALLVATI